MYLSEYKPICTCSECEIGIHEYKTTIERQTEIWNQERNASYEISYLKLRFCGARVSMSVYERTREIEKNVKRQIERKRERKREEGRGLERKRELEREKERGELCF